MKVDVRGVGVHLAALAWVALRTFLRTLFVLTSAGIILAGLAYYFLRECSVLYAIIGIALALIEAVATGVILGAKRAGVLTLAHALGSLRLGRSLVCVVFERMLGITANDELGERGSGIARSLERLPLQQAEQALNRAIHDVMGDLAQAGWLRRTIQRWLLEAVRRYTLASFREEGARHGGIDLLRVKKELEETVDDALVRKVRSGLTLWTLLALIGLPFVVAVQTWVILMLLRS